MTNRKHPSIIGMVSARGRDSDQKQAATASTINSFLLNGTKISISAIAGAAGVSRNFIYSHDGLLHPTQAFDHLVEVLQPLADARVGLLIVLLAVARRVGGRVEREQLPPPPPLPVQDIDCAALVDGFMVLLATLLFLIAFRFATGSLPVDKYALMAYGVAFGSIAASYKLLWCFADRDSFGHSSARLRVVDFDGNAPGQKRRFWRALSSFLSLGAAGLGLIWTFADADALAWHDQISGSFPTFSDE